MIITTATHLRALAIPVQDTRRAHGHRIVPAKAAVPTAVPEPCRVREVSGSHAPAYRIALLDVVVCTRTDNLPPFRTEPTRSATAKASAEEPCQLVPDVQRTHQRRAIHETIAALVLGKHSSGVIHEVEQVDVRDVIAAPVQNVGNVDAKSILLFH